jgi:hypothetical protein
MGGVGEGSPLPEQLGMRSHPVLSGSGCSTIFLLFYHGSLYWAHFATPRPIPLPFHPFLSGLRPYRSPPPPVPISPSTPYHQAYARTHLPPLHPFLSGLRPPPRPTIPPPPTPSCQVYAQTNGPTALCWRAVAPVGGSVWLDPSVHR